jgi:SAM-dependent methyltransferase
MQKTISNLAGSPQLSIRGPNCEGLTWYLNAGYYFEMGKMAKKQSQRNATYEGREELVLGEDSLDGYNRFIIRQFGQNLGHHSPNRDNLKVLDFGAGIGTLAILWKEIVGGKVECLEIDADQLSVVRNRGFTCYSSLSEIRTQYDFIYTSNVLEHIEDDDSALRELRLLLNDEGRLGVYVPAFMVLFSGLDKAVGHYRRYHKRELTKKIQSAGFEIIECKFVDSIGFFASLFIRIVGYKSVGNIGGSKSLKFYDSVVFPVSQVLDRLGLRYLFGKNLLVIATKTSAR